MAPTSIEPRPQLRECAEALRRSGPAMNIVIPKWDAPGIEYYLGAATTFGVLSPGEMPAERPARVNVVLTREALARKGEFLEAFAAELGQGKILASETPLRGAAVFAFVDK